MALPRGGKIVDDICLVALDADFPLDQGAGAVVMGQAEIDVRFFFGHIYIYSERSISDNISLRFLTRRKESSPALPLRSSSPPVKPAALAPAASLSGLSPT